MQLLNLAFAPHLTVSINPRIESPRRMLHQLLLPRVNLIGMNLVALSKIGHRCLFPQRLQRYPRLQRRVDPPSRLLHHFRSSPSGAADYPIMPWPQNPGPLLLVGGNDAVLVIDDTAIAKKGTHSVGVAPQYASALGKTANCQTLVSLTLARGEVPVVL